MNLLFLDSVDAATFGGYENWVLLVSAHFAEAGHRVTVAGRRGSEFLRRTRLRAPNAACIDLDINSDINPVTIWRLREYIKRQRTDIVTVNFNKDVRLGGLAARWAGPTRVVWRLGLDIVGDGFWHRRLTPRLVDGVIVPSEALRTQVLGHGCLRPEIVTVIYNGAADQRFVRPDAQAARRVRETYGLATDALVAAVVGRFVAQKGHRYLIEAAPRIRAACPSLRFLFLGNGPLQSDLKSRIGELGLTDMFVFAGMLDNLDLELAGADLLVHPAIEEPFSHAILEAMRAGLPIVASRVGGVPEALSDGESAILVPPAEPVALADAVIELCNSPARMSSFGAANQARWHKHFRLPTMIEKTEACFTAVLAGGPRWT
jgi:glycosyltransferase involved in cell wall biosynthesis